MEKRLCACESCERNRVMRDLAELKKRAIALERKVWPQLESYDPDWYEQDGSVRAKVEALTKHLQRLEAAVDKPKVVNLMQEAADKLKLDKLVKIAQEVDKAVLFASGGAWNLRQELEKLK